MNHARVARVTQRWIVSSSKNVSTTTVGAFLSRGHCSSLPFHAHKNIGSEFKRQDNRRGFLKNLSQGYVIKGVTSYGHPPFTISENIAFHHNPQPPHHLTQHLTPPTTAYVAAYLDRSLIFRLFLFRRRTRFLCHLARIFGSSFSGLKFYDFSS